MLKPLMASALILSLVLTSVSATPARAGGEDVAKVLGGLVLLYAIGRAVDDARADPQPVQRQVQPRGVNNQNRHRFGNNRKVIPNNCYREVVSRGEIRSGYGARCMQNTVKRAGSLPPNCLRQVETRRGLRNLYSGQCLQRNGWVRS